MVLAAGLGTRIRALDPDTPKPLIPVAGKPLIDYALSSLRASGVKRAVVNVHHRADQLEAHLRTIDAPEVLISDERNALLETGGGILKALPLIGTEPFFCTNTDAILAGGSLLGGDVLREAWSDDCDALLLMVPPAAVSGYAGAGDFSIASDGTIADPDQGDPLVYTGLQILRPSLFAGVEVAPMSTRVFWKKARAAGRMRGVVFDGAWMHVGDPDGHRSAELRLAELADQR
ncbi:MAG: nucleotidyltransferase family protein [Parvularculaceae bacterium]|nr:nucleotidyltransferase family protein [Parvularculaceae bacterium]